MTQVNDTFSPRTDPETREPPSRLVLGTLVGGVAILGGAFFLERRKRLGIVWTTPVPSGVVFSGWGDPRSDHLHRGVDIVEEIGTPVRAVADGRVTAVGEDDRSGIVMQVDHDRGIVSQYTHLDRVLVESGEVRRGEVIAELGRTGIQRSRPHLHLEIEVPTEIAREYVERFGQPSPPVLLDGKRKLTPVPAESLIPLEVADAVLARAAERSVEVRG